MYTYKGKVVLATANQTRLKRVLFKGYTSHNLYDELLIIVDGKQYVAIVLDVCGACYGVKNETLQRFDIFTVKNTIGKKKGTIYYE